MRKVCCVIILSFCIAGAFAQNVAVINGRPISNKEFMWFYKKNHSGNANATYQDLAAYLDLYINFKLKVMDARETGLDKDTAYTKEIENYESALRTQKRVSKSNAEYSFILNEYREAVLMFNISEKKIWERAQNDENQLRNFYENHKNQYQQSSFDEARGQVIADYQQKMEDEWIIALRKRYAIKVNHDEVRKLAKL
ncbi:hypothetical protein [Pedobacter frigoris]|uniref:hypothetical protein n=1 Tax=Pedobacter frigoris TaxID=2571272 RepID=UPI00292E153D|nr:hypothetical protein [Pedobacter frigoris]